MKFCKDCIHYKVIPGCYLQPIRHLCTNSKLGNYIVTGQAIYEDAEYCRKWLCGLEAKWFEGIEKST